MKNSTTAAPPPYKVYVPGERPDESRGPEIIGSIVSVSTLALIIVSLRIYVRFKHSGGPAIEDYVMTAAMAVLIVVVGIITAEVGVGAGRHIEYIHPDDLVSAMRLNYASQLAVLTGLGLARVSVCFFLLRFARSRWTRWTIHIANVVTILLTVVGVALTLAQCQPLAFVWDKSIPGGGTCFTPRFLVLNAYATSAISITLDIVLATLPIPMLWNVQLNRKAKIAVIGILSLGLFTVAAGIVKAIAMTKWGLLGDLMWDASDISIWYTTEIAVAIMAGSIPCLKPLFKRLLATTRRYGSSNNNNNPHSSSACRCKRSQTGGASSGTRCVHTNCSKSGGGGGGDDYAQDSGHYRGLSRFSRKPADPFSLTKIGLDDLERYSPDHSRRDLAVENMDPTPGLAISRYDATSSRTSDEAPMVNRSQSARQQGSPVSMITKTTQITVSVEADREKSVRNMV